MRRLGRWSLAGAALGALWGGVARLFMRLISDDPAFSWSGTGFIVGASAFLGGAIGTACGSSRMGCSNGWRLLPLPGLVLFLGPGLPFVPALAAGLIGGRSKRESLSASASAGAILSVAALAILSGIGDDSQVTLVTPRWMFGLLLYAVCGGAVGVGGALWSARRRPTRRPDLEPARFVGSQVGPDGAEVTSPMSR